MEKTKIELINFMMWFQSDTTHMNYDPVTAVNEYYKFINSASNESLSVRDNEGKKKICHECKGKGYYDSIFGKVKCERCKGLGKI